MSATQSPVPVLTTAVKGRMKAESVWGTAVTPSASNETLGSVSLTPRPRLTKKEWVARGYRLATAKALSEKASEIGFDGAASYTEIANFVKSIASGGSTNVDSYTVAAGGLLWPGAVVNSWSLKGNNESVDLSGSMLAKWYSGTDSASADAPAQVVIEQSEIVLKIAGATITRWFNWSVDASDIINMVRFGGQLEPGAVTNPETLKIGFAVDFEANATNMALINSAIANTLVEWQLIATKTSPAKTFSIVGKGTIDEINEFSDNEGVYGFGVKIGTMADGANALTVTAS